MKLGFIGLGTMGAAMAMNLVRAGHEVTVWNRTREATKPLADAGAHVADDPAGAMQGEAVMSLLANDAAIRAVGLDGPLLDKAAPGVAHSMLSTISPAFARELAEAHAQRGLGFAMSNILGRAEKALDGTLTVIVAGAPAAVKRLQPLYEVIGSKVTVVSETPEHAALLKIAANFMMAASIEVMGEAFALVRKSGLDANTFYDLTADQFPGPIFRNYGRLILDQNYTPPGFSLRLGLKDVDLALGAATEMKVPMPIASLVHDQFLQALAHDMGELDWVAIAEVVAAKAGLPSVMKSK
jgi:3-hydroxyisobutyrate dehydrogenase-like beta-hydroxyacid dehydrogenase